MNGVADKPRRRSDLVVHDLDGEAVLYDPRANLTHRLNGSGLFIWRHCDGSHTADGIVTALTQTYDVAPEVARRDVVCAIEQMTDNLILESLILAER